MDKPKQVVATAFNHLALPLVAAVPLAYGAGFAPGPWNLVCGVGAVACLMWGGLAYTIGRQAITESFAAVAVREPPPEDEDPFVKKMRELAERRALRKLSCPPQAEAPFDPAVTVKLPSDLARPSRRAGPPEDRPRQK